MGRKKTHPSSIVLPWERHGGWVQRLGLSRAKPLLAVVAAVLLFVAIGYRERQAAGTRATRAALLALRQALDLYRADHGRQCPASLGELEKKGYLGTVPTDAWGRPFALACPGRFDPHGYELSSAGPDGEPGGLDRIE
jgi:general secretion pathway protein G